ncbi:MAG: phage virion morphogenesis protein [Arenimonas sp.]
MALRITFTIEGEAQFDRALSRFGDGVSDLRPAWSGVAGVLRQHMTRQFASEGSHGQAGGWKPLSKRYAKWKAKKFPGRPILEATGKMKRSLTGVTGDTVLVMQPLIFGIGTKRKYASYHQRGGGRLPQRKIIDLTEADKRDVARAIQRALVKMARSDGWEVREREA